MTDKAKRRRRALATRLGVSTRTAANIIRAGVAETRAEDALFEVRPNGLLLADNEEDLARWNVSPDAPFPGPVNPRTVATIEAAWEQAFQKSFEKASGDRRMTKLDERTPGEVLEDVVSLAGKIVHDKEHRGFVSADDLVELRDDINAIRKAVGKSGYKSVPGLRKNDETESEPR